MAPFVMLCLNSPNCYALFTVPSTDDHDDDDDSDSDDYDETLMMMMMMMMMTSSMTRGFILAERADEGLWPI